MAQFLEPGHTVNKSSLICYNEFKLPVSVVLRRFTSLGTLVWGWGCGGKGSSRVPDSRFLSRFQIPFQILQIQGFTSFGMGWPSIRIAFRLSTTHLNIPKRPLTDCDPQCGVMITLSMERSGWSLGNGSGSVTSRAAPRI